MYLQAPAGPATVQVTIEVDRATAATPEWSKGAEVLVEIDRPSRSGPLSDARTRKRSRCRLLPLWSGPAFALGAMFRIVMVALSVTQMTPSQACTVAVVVVGPSSLAAKRAVTPGVSKLPLLSRSQVNARG